MELPWDAALFTWLWQWEFCRGRACFSFRVVGNTCQMDVAEQAGQGEGSASEIRTGPVARSSTSQEPYWKSLSARCATSKIVFDARSTALGAIVGLASASSASWAVVFRTSTGSHRTEMRTAFSLRNSYIHFSSNWLQIHRRLATSTTEWLWFSFLYKCYAVWTK
jgi:hypothetical protein